MNFTNWMNKKMILFFQSQSEILNIYYTQENQAIGLMSRVFVNGPGDPSSIPGCVIPKTQKNGTWCCFA